MEAGVAAAFVEVAFFVDSPLLECLFGRLAFYWSRVLRLLNVKVKRLPC